MADCWTKNGSQKLTKLLKEETKTKRIVCFNCAEVGHKANSCPKPKQDRRMKKEKTKRVQTPTINTQILRKNEMMPTMDTHELPVTMNTGTSLMIIPRGFVNTNNQTGKMVQIMVAN